MNNKYFLAVCVLLAGVYNTIGQNIPDLSVTSVPGAVNSITIPSAFNQSGNSQPYLFNYKRVFEPQVPVTNEGSIDKNTATSQVLMSTQYYDGLGRAIQTVSRNKNVFLRNYVEIFDNRPSVKEYNFLPYAVGGTSGFQMNPFQDQKNFYDQLFPQESSTSYAVKQHNSSNTSRSILISSPGKSTAGQGRGLLSSPTLNSANDIVIWSIDPFSQYPQKIGFYNAGQLSRKLTNGSDGSKIEEFSDKEGKLICKRILVRIDSTDPNNIPGNPGGGPTNILPGTQWIITPYYNTTYYVYDKLGGVRFTLSPKATEKLKAANWQASADIIENLTDYIKYDNSNRITLKHFAGENGGEEYVYDKKNRKILSRNPGLQLAGKWAFTLYDGLDRPTVSGYVTSGNSRVTWQQFVDNSSAPANLNTANNLEYYIVFDNGEGTRPQTLNGCDIQSYVYYDNYNFGDPILTSLGYNSSFYNGNLVTSDYSVVPALSQRTRGLKTGTKTKVIKPYGQSFPNISDWIYSVNYYDDFGRVIQTGSKNFVSGYDYTSYQYNFKGQVLRNIVHTENPLCTTKPSTTIIKDFLYTNYSFRLAGVRQKIDNSDWVQISGYLYNDLGKISTKTLTTVETQRYDYDIAGRLTGINKAYAETGSTTTNTTFGESIKYDFGFTNSLYNGNISGIVWKGPVASPQKAYGYTYDLAGRMIHADYSEYTSPNPYSSAYWNNAKTDYSEKNIKYDANGNIIALKRFGEVVVNNTLQPQLIDNLYFHYRLGDLSNQFDYAVDSITSQTLTDYDFKDKSGSTIDYAYDLNGNLVLDDNKKINLGYNILDKPEQIGFTGTGDYIQYIYDARGEKLMELYYIGGSKYDFKYLPSVVYKSDVLQMVNHDEGYCLLNANNKFDYYYYVRDHLGNTRNVLQAQDVPISKQYLADHEIASANLENTIFDNIDLVRDEKPGSSDPNDTKAVILDANNPSKRIGTAILLQVMAGDQFNLSTDAYYETPDNGNPISPDEILSSLISTLSSGTGGITGTMENDQSIQLINQMFTPENYLGVYNGIVQSVSDPALPQAYLNYISFDENFRIIPEESGAIQISGSPGAWQTIGTQSPLTVGRNGYLAVYLSSMSPWIQPAFDKFKVSITRGNLVDENHYYPFGLTINLASQNPIYNRYLFLGNKLDKTNGLHLYDFNVRQYDPQIGRFLTIDPFHEYNNGYLYSKNNPVVFQDKTGTKGSSSVWSSIDIGYAWNASGIYGGGAAGFSLDKDQRRAGNKAFWTTVGHVAVGVIGTVLTGGLTQGEAAYVAAQQAERGAAEALAARESFQVAAEWRLAPYGGASARAGAIRGPASRLAVNATEGAAETALADYSSSSGGRLLSEYKAISKSVSPAADPVKPVAEMAAKSSTFEDVLGTKSASSPSTTAPKFAQQAEMLETSSLNPTHFPDRSQKQMQNLINDIVANGIQDPLQFVEHNGQNYIVGGNHRYFIAKRMGITELPVQRVQLPFEGYGTAADLQMSGSMPNYWPFLKWPK